MYSAWHWYEEYQKPGDLGRREMTTGRLAARRKSQIVLEHLVGDLLQGVYPVDSRLPPERELSEATGVSRTSVREALAILTAAGIAERRHGSGTYVRSAKQAALKKALALLADSDDPAEVFEWQQVLEPSIAKLAAQKATAEDLAKMATALELMREAVSTENRPAYSQRDRQFHMAIAAACKNSIVVAQMDDLVRMMNMAGWKSLKAYTVLSEQETEHLWLSLRFHEQVLLAIRDRAPDRLEQEFNKHYARVRRVVFDDAEGSG